MRDPAVEERVGPRRLLVHVRVEGVAGELGEVLDVRQRYPARARHHGVADPQLGQGFPERVSAIAVPVGAGYPTAGDGGQHARAGLHRRALHVMQHAADSAHFLSAARGRGSLAGSVVTADAAFAREVITGLAPWHGRLLVLDRDDAAESTGLSLIHI